MRLHWKLILVLLKWLGSEEGLWLLNGCTTDVWIARLWRRPGMEEGMYQRDLV